MKVLRGAAIEQILNMLDRSIFTRHAFDASFNSENGEIIKIVFKEHPEYLFITKQIHDNNWKTIECPGLTFTDTEESTHPEFSYSKNRIEHWTQRVFEDYAIHGAQSNLGFESLRVFFERGAESLAEPDKPFSEEESIEWKNRLDEMVERFEELRKQNEIQQNELDILKNEVENLKRDVTTLPKKTWVKAMGNRILNILERAVNTKAGQTLIEKTFKAMIGSDG